MMPQNLDDSKFVQHSVAEALYDNIAESPDELPFRKYDLLIVLEQNIAGLPGWWLCSFKGRQGICPGNRLRLLRGTRDCSQKLKNICEPNGLQQESKRLSWHAHLNRLSTSEHVSEAPQSVLKCDFNGDDDSDCRYDVPPFGQPIPVPTYDHYRNVCQDAYRKARNSIPAAYESPTMAASYDSQRYDIPRSTTSIIPLSPASSISSFSASVCGSNRSSIIPDYDVPSPRPLSTLHSKIATLQENDRIASTLNSYDVPLQISRELPLELGSAVENLEQLEKEVTGAINMLLSHASPLWRETDKLEPKLMDVKLAVLRLRSALHDLSEFGEAVLGNALNSPDRGLAQKLHPLTKTLLETNKVVQECAQVLEDCNWSIQILAKNLSPIATADIEINSNLDSLDQLITCARSLTEDVRRFASFVQGNATLLFKRNSRENEDTKNTSKSSKDGDYVNFESHKTLNEANSEVRSLLSHDMRKSFDLLIKEAEKGNALAQQKQPMEIDQNDKQVLSFYAAQCCTHSTHLTHAIDAFLLSVEHNQPPKVFLAHGKFVVLSAHRLVHIGDTVHQNLACVEINTRVARLSDALSDALASTVHKIKKAAVQFPSVVAVQEMVNSVVEVSHLARHLNTCLLIASQT